MQASLVTVSLEFLKRSDIRPVVFEATDMVGGIARPVNHGGNRIDTGGHRSFQINRSGEVVALIVYSSENSSFYQNRESSSQFP